MPLDAGDFAVLPFPYTDMASSKLRPALVLSAAWHNAANQDGLFAYVTSVPQDDPFAFPVTDSMLAHGALARPSWVRADKLFTIEQDLVRKAVARLAPTHLERVRDLVCDWVRGVPP